LPASDTLDWRGEYRIGWSGARHSLIAQRAVLSTERLETRAGLLAQRAGSVGPRVWVFCAPKGGVGKSSLALLFARYAALRMHHYPSVCLIDANVQQADISTYLGRYADQTQLQVLLHAYQSAASGPMNVDAIGRAVSRLGDLGAIFGLPREHVYHVYTSDVAMSSLYVSITRVIADLFPYVIVDTPVADLFHPTMMAFSQRLADAALFVLIIDAPNRVSYDNAQAWVRAQVQLHSEGHGGISPSQIKVLVNRCDDPNPPMLALPPGVEILGTVPTLPNINQLLSADEEAFVAQPALDRILAKLTGDTKTFGGVIAQAGVTGPSPT